MAIANNTTLQIKCKDTNTNKTSTTSITYVNPEATSTNLRTLAAKIVNLQRSGVEPTSIVKVSKEVLM